MAYIKMPKTLEDPKQNVNNMITDDQMEARKENRFKAVMRKVMKIMPAAVGFKSINNMNYNAQVKLFFVLFPMILIVWTVKCIGIPNFDEEEDTKQTLIMLIKTYALMVCNQGTMDMLATFMKRNIHIKIWLMFTFGFFLMNIMLYAYCVAFVYQSGFVLRFDFLLGIAALELMSFVVRLAFWMDVYSFCKTLKTHEQQPRKTNVITPISVNQPTPISVNQPIRKCQVVWIGNGKTAIEH